MSAYPPYTGFSAACTKCGRKSDADTRYQNCLSPDVCLVAGVEQEEEWLLRTCLNCGFEWREACISG